MNELIRDLNGRKTTEARFAFVVELLQDILVYSPEYMHGLPLKDYKAVVKVLRKYTDE